jgi:hypothetical protein
MRVLALIDDAYASAVMKACDVDLRKLTENLANYIDNQLRGLVIGDGRGNPSNRRLSARGAACGDPNAWAGPLLMRWRFGDRLAKVRVPIDDYSAWMRLGSNGVTG